jgi:16S rRNA (uracil1498-N3)-methyltransferase
VIPRPWGDEVPIGDAQRHHLERVLRRRPGAVVSYTDGAGTIGRGRLGEGAIARGEEAMHPAPPRLDLVVAPPHARDRVRFLVEKVAELGATSLRWIRTARSEGRPPAEAKARAWADAALAQSRGAWRLEVGSTSWAALADGPDPLLVADPAGGPLGPGRLPATILIGPEGGFDPEEVPNRGDAVTLGGHILRTETAAIAAVALCRAPR